MTRTDRVLRTLWDQWRLVEVAPVLVAVSGGGDSVALATGLVEVARGLGRRHDARVVMAHLDHGLRPESEEEARTVTELASRLDVPLVTRRLEAAEVAWLRGDTDEAPSGLDARWCTEPGHARRAGIQARARALRRSWLETTAAAFHCSLLALGHTEDDQAETVLLRLLRGSGSRGAAGMLPQGPGRAWRPLLGVPRQALRDWLESRDVSWIDDPSNRSRSSERVRVRMDVLPVLETMRPGAAAALARSARRLAEDAVALGEQAAGIVDRLFPVGAAPKLPAAALRELPIALRARVLDLVCDRLGVARLGAGPREAWLALIEGEVGGRRLAVPGGEWVRRSGNLVFLRDGRL